MNTTELQKGTPPDEDIPNPNEIELATIDRLVEEIRAFEKENPPEESVDQAFVSIDDVISGYTKKYLLDRNILVTYHGSLQFNDPHQLDLDLAFTSKEGSVMSRAVVDLIDNLQRRFESLEDWPKVGDNEGHCDTNFGCFSIEEVEKELHAIEAEGREIDGEDDMVDLYVGELLTSPVLFPEQEQLSITFRNEAKALLLKSPILRRAVIKTLQRVISVRQERRAEKLA